MYPRVEISIDSIVENVKYMQSLCGKNRSLTLVTKILSGNLEIVKKVLEKTKIENIADSHVKNLELYKDLPVKKWLIREPRIQ